MTTPTILLQQAGAGSGLSSILMIVALFVIFYFFMIRPQQKRQKEIKNFETAFSPVAISLPPVVSLVKSKM